LKLARDEDNCTVYCAAAVDVRDRFRITSKAPDVDLEIRPTAHVLKDDPGQFRVVGHELVGDPQRFRETPRGGPYGLGGLCLQTRHPRVVREQQLAFVNSR
jgi:hypothetical protein